MTRVTTCTKCWRINPCEVHSRPRNASWSPTRDRAKQHAFRQAVLKRDNFTCRGCGHHDPSGKTLTAHHIRDGYDVNAGETRCNRLANDCHGKVDRFAR